jgi:arabinofuranosyltransferase
MRQRLPSTSQFALWLLLLLVLALAVIVAMVQVDLPLSGIDDARIFMVYGQNLTSGEGLVYNPGGEQVEGFSSLLWLLMVAAGYLISPNPEYFLLVTGVVLLSATLAVLVLHVNKGRVVGLSGLILIAWVVGSPAFISWMSLALMDTVLWSALLIAAVVFTLEGRITALTIAVIAMVLARPEGMLWAPALILIAAVPIWVERGPLPALRALRPAVLAYLATLTSLTLWRLLTFGYPLPNTYYVKMSPDILYNVGHGLNYLIAFLYMNPLVLIGLVPAIAAILLNGRWFITSLFRPGTARGDDPRLRYVAVSLIALLALLVPVYMGGDHFGNFRFYQPVWPLLLLPAFAMLDVLKIRMPGQVGAVMALLIILAAFIPRANWFNKAYRDGLAHEITLAQEGQAVGRSMNALFNDDAPTVGVIRAGAIAGTYEGEVIDLMGLNNSAMAHAKGDRQGLKNHAAFNAEVFFSQQPELLLPMDLSQADMASDLQETLAWDNAVLKGLLTDPRFTDRYKLATVSDGKINILAFMDGSVQDQLSAQGLEVKPFEEIVLPVLGG